MLKRILLISLFSLLLLKVMAQQSDTLYTFRFVPQKNVFYVPYKGNGTELERLLNSIRVYSREIAARQMYLSVSSYAPSSTAEVSATRMGYLQSSRVKSELIFRGGITEHNFVTDRIFTEPFADTLRNVVIVTFPAGADKVEQIAGAEAAAMVRQYTDSIRIVALPAPKAEPQPQKPEQAEPVKEQAKVAEPTPAIETAAVAEPTKVKTSGFSLRANLLRWATLTPDLGVEWRINRNWGVLINGTWTSWSWDDKNRRYGLWHVSPEVHYYIGKEKRAYVGAMYHTGEFNYKFSQTGRQGSYHGGAITGGYQLPIGKCLAIDFSLGFGYTHADFDKYSVTDGVRVRGGNEVKNYWGINKAGVTLIWNIR